MVLEDFLQMGRLIESFSQVELVNIIAMLTLKIFVMEDDTLENLGAFQVSKQARDKEDLIDVFEFFWISKHINAFLPRTFGN